MSIVIIKCGGAVLQTPEQISAMMQEIARLKTQGYHPIVVHGGGPEISRICKTMGIAPRFVNGLRVTDSEMMPIVQMVLIGKINKELVLQLHQKGASAIGLSGYDGNLFLATQLEHPEGHDLGFVGKIVRVNCQFLMRWIEMGFVPVIAPVAPSVEGVAFNLNADHVASQMAISLQAEHLVFLSDVPGVLDGVKKIDTIESDEAANLIERGAITGGMIPKVESALAALEQGVSQVHILDGKNPHSLFLHLQEGKQMGTTFIPKRPKSTIVNFR